MPTYEYECQSCGHRFEKFQYMSEQPAKVCPNCHKHSAKRLISAGLGIIFKGSGFYATDYRKGKSSSKETPKPGSCPAAKGNNPGCSNCPAH